jgi:dihydropyrimidinase
MYEFGVARGRLDLNGLVRLCSENPARAMGVWPAKGSIAVGSDADLVLLDTETRRTVSRADFGYELGPYEGLELRGWPHM